MAKTLDLYKFVACQLFFKAVYLVEKEDIIFKIIYY